MKKLWFSLYDNKLNYKGTEPNFWDPETFAWSNEFSNNTTKIITELEKYLQKRNLSPYFNLNMTNEENKWNTLSLKTWDIELFKNQNQFPFTTSLIKKYPQILSVSFNKLEAGGIILPHCGDTNGILRCHLGLIIPDEKENCFLKVNEEIRFWEKGKWLIFTDAFTHEAVNKTSSSRYIMVIDIIREEFEYKRNLISATVMTSLFIQKRAYYFYFIHKNSPFLFKLIAFLLTPLARIMIKICNLIRVY
jgi:beta-hydroxylase